jgi:hypothetical protein
MSAYSNNHSSLVQQFLNYGQKCSITLSSGCRYRWCCPSPERPSGRVEAEAGGEAVHLYQHDEPEVEDRRPGIYFHVPAIS